MRSIKNFNAYVRGLVIKKFSDYYRERKKTALVAEDIDWLTDTFEESVDKIINNQTSFSFVIDEYIKQHPKHFSAQNKRLWEIFKHQDLTAAEMMAKMGINNLSAFYTAKTRLLDRIIKIYDNTGHTKLS